MQYHQWSTMSAREVNQLQKDLADLENGLTISDSTQQLRTELTNLRNKVHNILPLFSFFISFSLFLPLYYRSFNFFFSFLYNASCLTNL